MGQTTKIQWCDSTVNPVMGCSGCELWTEDRKTCYAGHLHRFRKTHKGFSPDFDTPKLYPGRMAEAARYRDLTGTDRPHAPWLNGLPRLIFVSDMGDSLSERDVIDNQNVPVHGGAVPFEFLKTEVIDAVISDNGLRHQWLWLTKRPRRMAEFSQWLERVCGIRWPANLWAGTSITNKATLGRARDLARVGDEKTVRFLSVEPQWEEISLGGLLGPVRWVIQGGESRQGSTAKVFECDWARKLREECHAAKVPFFLKQLGYNVTAGGHPLKLKDGHGGDMTEWPEDLRVRQFPQPK